MGRVVCRVCGAALTHTFVDLGMSPPCETYLRAEELDQGETFYPASRAGVPGVPARAAARVHPGRGHLQRLRVLLVVLRLLGRAREALRGASGRAARTGARLVRGGGGQQRRLPAPARCASRHPRPRHRAGGQHRRRRAGAGNPDRGRCSSGRRRASKVRAGTARPTSSSPTTSSPTCPTSSTSRRACVPWSPTTAWSASRSRTCSGSSRAGSTTRSTTSTSPTCRC